MAPKVKWDEANLEENEAIKAEINPTKIDEPKTPYHRPLSDDGDDLLDGTLAYPMHAPPPLRTPCPQPHRVAHPQTMYPRLAWRLWTLNQRYAFTRKPWSPGICNSGYRVKTWLVLQDSALADQIRRRASEMEATTRCVGPWLTGKAWPTTTLHSD